MYVHDPLKYQAMVKKFQDSDDPLGWFDTIYTNANGDHTQVFWADLEPSAYMLSWLDSCAYKHEGKKAIVIGCGVGDDAEALASYGYEVTAFDISPEAIKLCQSRYPNSKVNYLVENLFDYPKMWAGSFDLIYECNTIQVLPGIYRLKAQQAMVSLLAKGGHLLVSCRSRNSGEMKDAIPLPLDKKEISLFDCCLGLKELNFLAYDDTQEPPVPHFFACYTKA